MLSGFCFFFLVLLFLALLQEWRCAELLFLFLGGLGLAFRSLSISCLLLRCYGDFHRFWSAHAQLGYLDAQILLQLCQVVFPIGYCVCQQMKPSQWWWGMWIKVQSHRQGSYNILNYLFNLRHLLFFYRLYQRDIKLWHKRAASSKPITLFSWCHYGREGEGDCGAIKCGHLICISGIIIFCKRIKVSRGQSF